MIYNNQLISIIVPVYNTEQYVKRCIDSIIHQTYKNIEIIIIDDGSTDNTLKICKEYEKKDNRIRIISQKNSGPSAARNNGIKASYGEYVLFVDSDDWIDQHMVKSMYSSLIKNSADVAICDYLMTVKSEAVFNNNQFQDYHEHVFNNIEATKNLFVNGLYYSHVAAKLFKKELWHNVQYPINRKYEDLFTIPTVISKSCKTVYLEFVGYYYFEREGSRLNSNYSIRDNDYLEAYNYNIEYFNNKYSELLPFIKTKWCEAYICVYNKILKHADKNSLSQFSELYEKTFKRYAHDLKKESLNIYYMLMIIIMRLSPKLYNWLASFFIFFQSNIKKARND